MSGGFDRDRWQLAKRILDDALERMPSDRAAFVAEACADDAPLRREVESLLRSAEEDWSLVDAPSESVRLFPDAAPRSRIGERIGAYELISELGRGGMGQVFLARRADAEFEKKVAIKLVRFELAREDGLARFRSERQIAAALDHPNIARLLDGGTTSSGEPYFVMEYVEGQTLLDYCEEQKLSLRARLELFRSVCGAVTYAHKNLVVHRDIKPSNILVTSDGTPKLLDFGIAKLLDPEGSAGAAAQTGTLFPVMTPDYASPEQVRGRRVSTASDVYSLGVVLYELVAGEKPYRVETSDPAELIRVVCERDPVKPSAKASGIPADVDAIVLKALRKEEERRYSSVEALSEDIARYLDGRPVEAGRGTTAYRFAKFVRRHRVGVAAACVVIAAVAGGVWESLREARRARIAEARAERRFNDVRKLANSFLFEFHDAIRDLPGSTPARELLVKRALEYLDGLSKEAAGDRGLRRELAVAYMKVGDVQGNGYMPNLGDVPGALASYAKAIALLEPLVAAKDAGDEERSALATAYLVGAGIRLIPGDAKGAVAQAEKGLPLRRRLYASRPEDTKRARDLAQAWQFYGFFLGAAGRDDDSRKAYAEQAAILRGLLARDPADRVSRRSLSQNLYLSGESFHERGDDATAARAYAEAVSLAEALQREDPENTQLRRDLGYIYMAVGQSRTTAKNPAGGMDEFRLALAQFQAIASADRKNIDGSFGVALSRHNIGLALKTGGDLAGALEQFENARPLYEHVVVATPSNSWAARMLADLHFHTGLVEEALGASTHDTAHVGRACAAYSRATEAYRRLRDVGALDKARTELFHQAESAVARCPPRRT